MRGRKPTPTHLKVLNGNPGKRPINRNEPRPTPKVPNAPTTLSKEAKAEWRRVISELDRLGMVTLVDRAALSTYCMAWALATHADSMIQKHGAVLITEKREFETEDGTTVVVCTPVKNPYLQIFKDNAAIMIKIAAEFGFTPSSRSRIDLPKPDEEDLMSLLRGPVLSEPSS